MIGRIRRNAGGLFAPTAFRQPCSGELFAVAAALDKVLFQGGNLLIEQVVGLVDQANQGVGPDGGVFVLQSAQVQGPPFRISQIG